MSRRENEITLFDAAAIIAIIALIVAIIEQTRALREIDKARSALREAEEIRLRLASSEKIMRLSKTDSS